MINHNKLIPLMYMFFYNRTLLPSKEVQVYCKAFIDETSEVDLPGFSSPTNCFQHGINLYDHSHETLRKTFEGSNFLTDIITTSEDNPQAQGGIFDLLNSLKMALTVHLFCLFLYNYLYK